MQTIEIFWDQKLGAGGEGEVFKGRYAGQAVAVKVPLNHRMMWQVPHLRAAGREGLQNELQRRNHVQGEHHVKLLTAALDNPIPCLVFELAEKGSLADEMAEMRKRGEMYQPLAALARIEEILCALREVHDCNIIHRDVKPANFLKFADDRIKLNDFGLGRTADRACSQQTQLFRGTAVYAAPEQLAGLCVTHKADLFAVGAILYEMLTGVLPGSNVRPLVMPAGPTIRPELRTFGGMLVALAPENRYCCARKALNELAGVRTAYQARSRPCPRCGQFHQGH